MLWVCAAGTSLVTFLLWRSYRQLKEAKDATGLATACLAATIFGVIGTLCFIAAALI